MKDLKKVCVLGHFAEGKTLLNGQTIKTKIVTEELKRQFGESDVVKIDTHGGLKTLLKAPFQAFRALKKAENAIIFPAHNGVRVYVPLLALLRKLFRGRKLHYSVIGGWLPEFLESHKRLVKHLRAFDGIYAETETMKKKLEEQGLRNVITIPNCKELSIVPEKELSCTYDAPYRICTFSRVEKEKGIETAVEVIKQVNQSLGYVAYSLDIYGQIDLSQKDWFDNLKEQFPDYIHYCGCVDSDQSVTALKNYFALIFPTHHYTEGVPGTIIDAYAAGIPVISAKWENFSDVVDDGKTGVGYTFDDCEEFAKILISVVENAEKFLEMKLNCVIKAKDYEPQTALKKLIDKMNG